VAALHLAEQGLIDPDANVNHDLVSWQVPENEFAAQEKGKPAFRSEALGSMGCRCEMQ
jgi:hypothetical protein